MEGAPTSADGRRLPPARVAAVMTVPMIILAVGSVGAGAVLSAIGLTEWLAPSVGELAEPPEPPVPCRTRSIPWLVIAFSALGVFIAWVTVGRQPVPVERPAHVPLPVRAARRDVVRERDQRDAVRPARHLADPRARSTSTTAASTGGQRHWRRRWAASPADGAGCRTASSARTRCPCSPAPSSSSALCWRWCSREPPASRPAGVPAGRRPRDVPAAGEPARGQDGRDRHGAAADRARGRHLDRLLGGPPPRPASAFQLRVRRRLDPVLRHPVRARRRRHRAGHDRADRVAGADRAAASWEERLPAGRTRRATSRCCWPPRRRSWASSPPPTSSCSTCCSRSC